MSNPSGLVNVNDTVIGSEVALTSTVRAFPLRFCRSRYSASLSSLSISEIILSIISFPELARLGLLDSSPLGPLASLLEEREEARNSDSAQIIISCQTDSSPVPEEPIVSEARESARASRTEALSLLLAKILTDESSTLGNPTLEISICWKSLFN